MTFEELKAKLDEFVGLVSEPVSIGVGRAELIYKSPTGRELFRLQTFEGDGKLAIAEGWQFGGNSQALPGAWQELCSIHR